MSEDASANPALRLSSSPLGRGAMLPSGDNRINYFCSFRTVGVIMIDRLYKIAKGLNIKFPDGNEPFMIITRLAEECGEVAAEVNHFERKGVKVERLGAPDRKKFAKELQDVMRAVLHLALYYGLEDELAKSVDESYRRVVSEGLVEPLTDEPVGCDEK
jgi:NTP pyrophosphatase (non-canonical NTP hydrolase)